MNCIVSFSKFLKYQFYFCYTLSALHLSCSYNKSLRITLNLYRNHPLNTYAKFSEKLTFLTPWYAHVRARIRGSEMLVFRKILRTYLMDEPIGISELIYSALHYRNIIDIFVICINVAITSLNIISLSQSASCWK